MSGLFNLQALLTPSYWPGDGLFNGYWSGWVTSYILLKLNFKVLHTFWLTLYLVSTLKSWKNSFPLGSRGTKDDFEAKSGEEEDDITEKNPNLDIQGRKEGAAHGEYSKREYAQKNETVILKLKSHLIAAVLQTFSFTILFHTCIEYPSLMKNLTSFSNFANVCLRL